jgi:hypothetical protein
MLVELGDATRQTAVYITLIFTHVIVENNGTIGNIFEVL